MGLAGELKTRERVDDGRYLCGSIKPFTAGNLAYLISPFGILLYYCELLSVHKLPCSAGLIEDLV